MDATPFGSIRQDHPHLVHHLIERQIRGCLRGLWIMKRNGGQLGKPVQTLEQTYLAAAKATMPVVE